MIRVDNVQKNYKNTRALNKVSFSISQGEVVGLLGPNGAGKTTLLKVLTGFFEPTYGRVHINDVDIIEHANLARRHIGYLPENAPLYPELLVQESLMMTSELLGIPESERIAHIKNAIQATNLEDKLTSPISTLSKGFKQRVGLAQAILHKPQILILDEPTNGLDPQQIIEVRKLIKSIAENATVILSTHILSEVEQTCERVLIIMDGELKADAKLAELTDTKQYCIAFAKDEQLDKIHQTLSQESGIQTVTMLKETDHLSYFNVSSEQHRDLAQKLYELSASHQWPLRELYPNTRTLESVFRDLSAGKEVVL